jgi:DNA-binding transcriptional regulator of glucitol operon
VPSGPSRWKLLYPKWMLLHVFAIAACCAMVWLGQWQWQQAHRHHGEIRNYAYALQWWAFTGFTLLMWWRVVRDYLRSGEAEETPVVVDDGSRYVRYEPPTEAVQDDDPERARFNAYLAELNAADIRSRAKDERTMHD